MLAQLPVRSSTRPLSCRTIGEMCGNVRLLGCLVVRYQRRCPLSSAAANTEQFAAASTAPVDSKMERSAQLQNLAHLLATLTREELDLDHTSCVELLTALPEAELEGFGADLWADHRQRVVHSEEELTVLDTYSEDGTEPAAGGGGSTGVTRSLHFNSRLDLVQSAVALDAEGRPLHDQPPPLTGRTGTFLQGLSLAFVARHALTRQQCGDDVGAQLDVALLGAGAGALAGFLHDALRPPSATARKAAATAAVELRQLTALELSAPVVAAARTHFGLGAAEAAGGLTLRVGCAYEFLRAEAAAAAEEDGAHGYDVLLVDLEDGSAVLNNEDARTETGSNEEGPVTVLAPPLALYSDAALLEAAARVLRPGGALAINVIAHAHGDGSSGEQQALARGAVREVARRLRRGTGAELAYWVCDVPEVSDGAAVEVKEGDAVGGAVQQSIVIAVKGRAEPVHGAALGAAAMGAAMEELPRLLERREAWLANWAPLD